MIPRPRGRRRMIPPRRWRGRDNRRRSVPSRRASNGAILDALNCALDDSGHQSSSNQYIAHMSNVVDVIPSQSPTGLEQP